MATTKEKKEIRLEKVLADMSFALNHIEDMVGDNRAVLIKLVKQNNSIVNWLKQIEIDEVTTEYEDILQPELTKEEKKKMKKFESLKEVLDEFMDKRKDLIEFEKELKKYKNELMPGVIGESKKKPYVLQIN